MAADYLGKAIESFENIKMPEYVAVVQRDQGLVRCKEKKYNEAFTFLEQSVAGLEKSTLAGQLGMSQSKLGLVQAEQGNVDIAIGTIKKAIATLEKTKDTFFLSTVYLDLTRVYKNAGKIVEAKNCCTKIFGYFEWF